MGEEDPVERRAKAGRIRQVGDAVVGQGPAQLEAEGLGQALRVGVSGAQVGVHVLLRVAGGLGVHGGLVVGPRLVRYPAVAPQRGHVGEDLQDLGLGGQQPRIVGGQFGSRGGQPSQLPPGLGLLDVEAEHQGTKRRQRVGGVPRGVGRIGVASGPAGQRAQIGPDRLTPLAPVAPWDPGIRLRGLIRRRLDPEQLGAALHLGVDVGEHLGDPAGRRGAQRGLQLHALHDGHHVAFGDFVARPRPGWPPPWPGAGARTSPASPPEIRCTAPSTSTR